ncbi:MAG: TetR/AcrR family transcriptional regulator [Clostridiales bacterium]|nr:TetR/AcrR family transcriptional regulator [Clostridiales bacterium]
MKQAEASLRTKQAMAASLKKLACQKSFAKITVRDIITDCNVNRKTFYYHFEDIYALLRWTLEQEAIEVVKNFDLLAEYEEAVAFVLDYVEENTQFIRSVYHSLGQNELKRFFYRDFIAIVRAFIDKTEQTQNLSVPEGFKEYLCDFYAEAVAGSMLAGIDNPEKYNREKIMKYVLCIISSTIPSALQAAAGLTE